MSYQYIKSYFFKLLIAVVLFLTTMGSLVQEVLASPTAFRNHQRPIRILLIGNSFSQNATTYLKEISIAQGHKIIIGRAEIGGSSLQKHWTLVKLAKAEPDNPKGKPYGGKSLQMLLSEGEWDVVTLQQYSALSADIATYMPYIKNLYDMIKSFQPKAEIVLHQTWAYRSDSKKFGKVSTKKHATTEKEMYEKSRAAYHAIADSLHIRIIPTGDAFWMMSTDRKWMYRPDEKFDFKHHNYPDLPGQTHSLHVGYIWGEDQKLKFDTHHASNAGKYLGSLVWYSFLFNKPANEITFVPDDIPAKFALKLRKCADEATKNSKR